MPRRRFEFTKKILLLNEVSEILAEQHPESSWVSRMHFLAGKTI